MPNIKIIVQDKKAIGDQSRIVCGNSDYSILFDFDAEWDEYDVKTARFVYAGMTGKYIDVVFSGTTCKVPVLQDTIGVYVGVYAGELHTTTPAWFECDKSILCGGGSPAAPSDDVYNQIMERLNKIGTPDAEVIAAAVADYIAENPIEEKDPTVPAWAKAATKPGYTAHEVGADPAGTATARVSEHNTEATAHSDMRLLIQGLTDRLNALADSDDTTLDQLSEIVAYIKSNRDLIAAVTTDKVSVEDIVNDLVTNVANKPLSAAQGVALKALIDTLTAAYIGAIPVPATATVGQTIRVSAVDETGKPTEWEAVDLPEQVQADWNQNDSTAANYVKNRPFYDSRELSATFSAAEVSKNPLEEVYLEDFGDTAFLLKASNKVYTKNDIQGLRLEVDKQNAEIIWHQDDTACSVSQFWFITLQDNVDFNGIIIPTAGVWVANPTLIGVEDLILDIYSGELVKIQNKYIGTETYNVIQYGTLGEATSSISINIDGYRKVVAKIALHGKGSDPSGSSLYEASASLKATNGSLVDIYTAEFTYLADSTNIQAYVFFVYTEYENTGLAQVQIFTTTGTKSSLGYVELRKSALVSAEFEKSLHIDCEQGIGKDSIISVYGIE